MGQFLLGCQIISGYSGNLGTVASYTNFSNKIQVSKIVTQSSAWVFRVRAMGSGSDFLGAGLGYRIFGIQALGIRFYAHREYEQYKAGAT